MLHHICKDNSIAGVFLAQLRDVNQQGDRALFRRNLERMGEIFAYEISKLLTYQEIQTETPLGTAVSRVFTDEVVIASILRAGLPMHQGFLNYFSEAENCFVAARRIHHKDGSFDVDVEYITCPDIEEKVVILCDPMIATGSSVHKTMEAILKIGNPRQVHIATAIISSYGLEYIRRMYPRAHIWIAAEDEELTAKSYVVPGLGDAGDLAFGGKTESHIE
ncbi:MAG TPA: uracil phosphoribosyltransferase [Saprospiraceae bacterium]|nr:uracil phosphoribosyltransferase [Saprospiraceae bacterium]